MEQDLGYRRMQLTGRGSYIISLPKEWVVTSHLKKGSQLAVIMQEDSSLLLIPRQILEKREERKSSLKDFTIQVSRKDDPQSISRKLMALYAISADVIRITFNEGALTPEQRTSIKNTVIMLLGSEIIAETSNEIAIQVLISHPTFLVEKAIRRMFAIALTMDQNVISAFKTFDETVLHDVITSDNDLDRLNLYVVRQLKYGIEHFLYKDMGFKSPKEFLGYRIVAKNLENVGDNAVGLAKNILAIKTLIDNQTLFLRDPIDEEAWSSVLTFNSFSHGLLEDSLKALFKRDYHLADGIISRFMSTGLELERQAFNLILTKRMDPNVASVLRLFLDSSRKMIEYGRDIAEVTLNRTVEEISTSEIL